MYVPGKDLGQFNRISFPSSYSDAVAPAGHAAILAEITFRDGDPVASLTDEQLVEHVVSGLCRMGILSSPEAVVYSHVDREPFAYVIYDWTTCTTSGSFGTMWKAAGLISWGGLPGSST